ncbi:MAG: helix-turn-helix domain-containing protein [Acidiferrobacteraceae bacterium]
MKTLTLKEAAVFLKMHPQTLRRLALNAELPAARTGRRWVFIEEDLATWLRSRYSAVRQVPAGQEGITPWHSTNDATQRSGGSASPSEDGKYAALLGLRTGN